MIMFVVKRRIQNEKYDENLNQKCDYPTTITISNNIRSKLLLFYKTESR